MKRHLRDLNEMRSFAQEIGDQIRQLDVPRVLILLFGPMGAGKTQFSRYFLEFLGSQETASPSFAIHHRHNTAIGHVDHFDLFRVESGEDLESTGFWDFFLETKGIALLEWADRLETLGAHDQLPRSWQKIKIKITTTTVGSEEREIDIEGF